jgi:hypothetical protein
MTIMTRSPFFTRGRGSSSPRGRSSLHGREGELRSFFSRSMCTMARRSGSASAMASTTSKAKLKRSVVREADGRQIALLVLDRLDEVAHVGLFRLQRGGCDRLAGTALGLTM